MASPKFDYSHLSAEERIALAEELWESLRCGPEAIPLSEAQARELDRRVEAYRHDGDPGEPWEEAIDGVERRLRERREERRARGEGERGG